MDFENYSSVCLPVVLDGSVTIRAVTAVLVMITFIMNKTGTNLPEILLPTTFVVVLIRLAVTFYLNLTDVLVSVKILNMRRFLELLAMVCVILAVSLLLGLLLPPELNWIPHVSFMLTTAVMFCQCGLVGL